jgi:uncharacterized protein
MTVKGRRSGIDRRSLLRGTGAALGALALATPFRNLHARQLAASGVPIGPRRTPFGPLAPVPDRTTGLPLLRLPSGFRYASFGWTGDMMSDGTLTPNAHDGMSVVTAGGAVTLIRNHERGPQAPGAPTPIIGAGRAPVYDAFQLPGVFAGMGGGTTALVVRDGRLIEDRATLGGTLGNCAGGPTPWGSWLTCEEIRIRGAAIGARDHGYVYEVPDPTIAGATARPIKAMGFMDHEAVAVEPRTGFVYLTEDNSGSSGFYRYRPANRARRPGALEDGGTLEMLKVVGVDRADLRNPEQGEEFDVEWVAIPKPDADSEQLVPPLPGFPPIAGVGRSGPFMQGEAAGGAFFNRGEGCREHRGVIYFVDTTGGPRGNGVIWAYVPGHLQRRDSLVAIFVSPDAAVAHNPDNITVSPRGGILVCEDGSLRDESGTLITGARLLGVGWDGTAFPFCENNMVLDSAIPGKPFIAPGDYRGIEFAGAAFGPSGDDLYVNIQTPGVTFAIQGPFRAGGF